MPIGSLFKPEKTAEPAVFERRRSVRHIAVLQVAKLRAADGCEELCLLRDVSESGLRAEVYLALSPDDAIAVELRTGHSVTGRVIWCEPPMLGMAFDEAVPILSMLAHCAFDERLTRLRPPRIDLDLAATLHVGGQILAARARNISQEGVGLHLEERLAPETRCEIALPAFAPRRARLRWSHRGECGLQFEQALSFREFALWRRRSGG